MVKRLKIFGWSIALAFVVVVIDQLTKAWVFYHGLSYVLNTGGVFGLFPGKVWIQGAVIGLVLLILIYSIIGIKKATRLELTAMGLLLGGGLGNMIDRLRLGGVVDFIDIGFLTSFNVSDIAIIIGLVIAFWDMLFSRHETIGASD